MNSPIIIKVKGKSTSLNTLEQITSKLENKKIEGKKLHYEDGDYYLYSEIYDDLQHFELGVTSSKLDFDVILEEEEADDKILILRFSKELIQHDQENDQIKVTNKKSSGAMLFFNNYQLKTLVPKEQKFHLINIRIRLNEVNKITRNRFPEFVEAMTQNKPIFFYELLTAEMEELIEKIFQVQNNELGRIGLSLGYGIQLFTLFFMQLENRWKGSQAKTLSVDTQLMLRIRDYLIEQIDKKISIEEVCEHFGVSPQKLRNHFRSAFGFPPHQFVQHYRIIHAKKMLADPQYSLTDIAYALGYANPNHFSKSFKKDVGISPKKYRKSI
ncbi:helix-turn-helix domain-containing protein [Flammeovirga pacifica]|uniref:HTH araC/xylS-type domain-containing protein n=1 Tax=Flammeovirga pacifica TaxID=915059 RepID=A0A1S1YU94_FLAPC|nr:AraC family transcriptional regulator [Flammeovirga pacifica]OHX64602.1 hypothetical protein NH26_23820 [Flammeovirga pacifica]